MAIPCLRFRESMTNFSSKPFGDLPADKWVAGFRQALPPFPAFSLLTWLLPALPTSSRHQNKVLSCFSAFIRYRHCL